MSEEIQFGSEFESTNQCQPQSPMRIGELLIKEGFARKQDIEQALAIQRQEKELFGKPLGQILVKTGALSTPQLDELLNHPDLRSNIGSFIVEKGFLERSRLESAIERKPPGQYLGDYLVQEGLITADDLEEVLREQLDAPRFGELALRLRLIKGEDLNYALTVQKSTRALGEILCAMGVINPLDLNYVLNKYKKQNNLGETLLKLGYIDEENLNKALMEQKQSSEPLGSLLVKKKLINNQQLQEALSHQANIPFKSLEKFSYDETEKRYLRKIISQKFAEKNLVLPVSLKGKDLTVAIVSQQNIEAAREIRSLYNSFSIYWILITEEKFRELFEILYSKRLGVTQSIEEEKSDPGDIESIDFMEVELNEEMEENDDSPVFYNQDIETKEIVNFIIKYGVNYGASDIHIEQDREGAKLRYRIDGMLREVNIGWLKKKLQQKAGPIISRIKVLSNLDIAERRIPQDGVFRINYHDKTRNQKADLDFRVATCRAITGENIVIRILDSRKANVSLEDLNHSPQVLEPFKLALGSSSGIILVTGPTGSGKSSTLYGALKYIYKPELKIITAEDPIEYSFPGIMQTQVKPKINLSFARLMRSFLRLDPDIIMVGEMRDEETAKIGFYAAQTGHLVLSTLHTNDSVSSISRLLDMNLDRAQVASCLSCVLAQRLVRKICPSCKEEYIPEDKEWFLLFDRYPSHLKFYRGNGCEDCGFTGYKGRTLLSEALILDKEITKALNRGVDIDDIRHLTMEKGMLTMLDDGLRKLKEITLSDLTRVIPYEMMEVFRIRNRTQEKMSSRDGVLINNSFVVTDPARDVKTIDRMHEKYQELSMQVDRSSVIIDRETFQRFISERHSEICQSHRCSDVKFSIERVDGRVEFFAVAGMEDQRL